jgi:hypothetical protein
MKILCKKKPQGRPAKQETQSLKQSLLDFYDHHYSNLMTTEKLDYTYMNTILDYLTIDLLTVYETNIKQHFVECIERYVNVVWKKQELINFLRKSKWSRQQKDIKIRQLISQLRKIKNDVLNVNSKKLTKKEDFT